MPDSFIVDFTFNEKNRLTILEFGLLEHSLTNRTDTKKPNITKRQQIEQHLRETFGKDCYHLLLDSFSCTISSLNTEQSEILKREYRLAHAPKYSSAYKLLVAVASIRNPPIKIALSLNEKSISTSEKTAAFLSWYNTRQSNSPSALIMLTPTKTFYDVCRDKSELHKFFKDSPIYPKTYLGDLTKLDLSALEGFENENKSELYVLKPTDETSGTGVVVLKKSEVLPYIKSIVSGTCNEDYWKEHVKSPFLLQVCMPSKLVIAENGLPYRPTGRLVFITDEKRSSLKLLNAYWKLPEEPLNNSTILSRATLISKTCDKESTKNFSAPISDADLSEILKQFKKYFFPVYKEIQNTDRCKYKSKFPAIEQAIATENIYEKAKNIARFVKRGIYRSDSPLILSFLLAGLPWEIIQTRISEAPSFYQYKSYEVEYAARIISDCWIGKADLSIICNTMNQVARNKYSLEALLKGISPDVAVKVTNHYALKALQEGISPGVAIKVTNYYALKALQEGISPDVAINVTNDFSLEALLKSIPSDTAFKIRTKLELNALTIGIPSHDVFSPWFSYIHYEKINDGTFTINEIRGLSCQEVYRILGSIKAGSPKNHALMSIYTNQQEAPMRSEKVDDMLGNSIAQMLKLMPDTDNISFYAAPSIFSAPSTVPTLVKLDCSKDARTEEKSHGVLEKK